MFAVPLSTVQYWVTRTRGKRLDRIDWNGQTTAPQRSSRTSPVIERMILTTRQYLKDKSVLGEFGAAAIHRELQGQLQDLPSLRTIGRILERHGCLDARRRVRRPAPPLGWYLPEVAARVCELDCLDTIEGLAIQGGPHLSVLTAISLLGGLSCAWPARQVSAKSVVTCLSEHWQTWGCPGYAQFDNDNRFTGPRQHPGAVGRVIRLCLNLSVTPVFAVPNETGFQAAIESFNGRWQAKVWQRFHFTRLDQLQRRSQRYIQATWDRSAARREAAPGRTPVSPDWQLNLQAPMRGRIIFLRRTSSQGTAEILGHTFIVDRHWTHRLVRAEVDLDMHHIHFFALRRRAPQDQPLLQKVHYELPNRLFKE